MLEQVRSSTGASVSAERAGVGLSHGSSEIWVFPALDEIYTALTLSIATLKLITIAMRRKITIGEVLEVRTPRGFVYLQYTHYKKPYGTLIRVLPGCYQSRPVNFSQVVQNKELYFVFCPVQTLVDQGLLEVVASEKIPATIMRKGLVRPITKGGGVSHWAIMDGENELRVSTSELSREQRQISIAEIWSFGMLVKRLPEGWLPEMDVGAPNAKSNVELQTDHPGSQIVRHFLYFPTEAVARQAQARLSGRPGNVQVKPSAKGEQWLLLVSDHNTTPDTILQARSKLEKLAAELKGEYDGWDLG